MYASTPARTLWESNLKAVCALSLPLGFRYLLCFGQRIDQSFFGVTAHPEVLCLCGWLLGEIQNMCTDLRQKLEARCVVIPNRFALMYLCVALSNPHHTCLLLSASLQTFLNSPVFSQHITFLLEESTLYPRILRGWSEHPLWFMISHTHLNRRARITSSLGMGCLTKIVYIYITLTVSQ